MTWGQTKNKRESIEWVLQDMPRISTAPRSITKCAGWDAICKNAVAVDKFTEQRLAEELHKEYKSVDEWGNVWIITNPWAWQCMEMPKGAEQICKMIRPKPRLAFTYEQALQESRIVKPLPNGAHYQQLPDSDVRKYLGL